MSYERIDFENYIQLSFPKAVKNDESIRVIFYGHDSNGDVYTINNASVDDTLILDNMFKEMYRNQIGCTIDKAGKCIEYSKKDYDNIYKVFYLNRDRRWKDRVLPYEWCIVKSDIKLEGNDLLHHTLRHFLHVRNRVEVGLSHFGYQAIK